MTDELLVYGSYGYTGALVTERTVESGLSSVLAGRRAEAVERQATDLGLDHRVFSLEHPSVVEKQVAAFDAVLNCAGPFSTTAEPLAGACLRTGTDYLDIAGEIDVLETLAGWDDEAESADVTLLPAVGFDVVPTDCLAAHLAEQVTDPTYLTLALDGLDTYSPGTLKSIVEGIGKADRVREDGELRDVPAAWKTRDLDFGRGLETAVTIPWGDVSTAYHTTGIPNVEVYATVPERAVGVMRRTRRLTPLLGAKPVQRAAKRVIDATVAGPTADERARSVVRVRGEVENDEGDRAVARLRVPDTYGATARFAVEAARRALGDDVESGFRTPASAFGPDFVLEFDGIEREDVHEPRAVESPGEHGD